MSLSELCRQAGVSRWHFYRALRPDKAHLVDIDMIYDVLEHPACGLTEQARAQIGLAYLWLKASNTGAARAAVAVLEQLSKEVERDISRKGRHPLLDRVAALLSTGIPERDERRRGMHERPRG